MFKGIDFPGGYDVKCKHKVIQKQKNMIQSVRGGKWEKDYQYM